jgi:hypothetical protein
MCPCTSHLLNCLEKDVYYAIDASSSTDESSPSLTLSIKEKYPEIDPALSFHEIQVAMPCN